MWSPRRWWRQRLLRRHAIAEPLWPATVSGLSILTRLTPAQWRRLRELATLLLATKTINGAGGFEPDDTMRVTVAALAALPILGLDPDWYDNWHEIVLYADTFVQQQEWQDDGGVVHRQRRALEGEAWPQGPVLLSWHDIAAGVHGGRLVIHELAHKLDMLNGPANGLPPLHRGMNLHLWTETFRQAYADLARRVAYGEQVHLDPYGTTNPAEFFAVASEAFFAAPQTLYQNYPELYQQLSGFYRQQPFTI